MHMSSFVRVVGMASITHFLSWDRGHHGPREANQPMAPAWPLTGPGGVSRRRPASGAGLDSGECRRRLGVKILQTDQRRVRLALRTDREEHAELGKQGPLGSRLWHAERVAVP